MTTHDKRDGRARMFHGAQRAKKNRDLSRGYGATSISGPATTDTRLLRFRRGRSATFVGRSETRKGNVPWLKERWIGQGAKQGGDRLLLLDVHEVSGKIVYPPGLHEQGQSEEADRPSAACPCHLSREQGLAWPLDTGCG